MVGGGRTANACYQTYPSLRQSRTSPKKGQLNTALSGRRGCGRLLGGRREGGRPLAGGHGKAADPWLRGLEGGRPLAGGGKTLGGAAANPWGRRQTPGGYRHMGGRRGCGRLLGGWRGCGRLLDGRRGGGRPSAGWGPEEPWLGGRGPPGGPAAEGVPFAWWCMLLADG